MQQRYRRREERTRRYNETQLDLGGLEGGKRGGMSKLTEGKGEGERRRRK